MNTIFAAHRRAPRVVSLTPDGDGWAIRLPFASTADPRATVTRPAGPDGPAVLAVYGDGPRPIVTVSLTPRRVLRLAGELLASIEPAEIGTETPAHAHLAGSHPDDDNANPEPSQGP